VKPRQIPSRNEPLRIVAIGGGSGLSMLLKGLKEYARPPALVELTAVVTVTDDGGSSGRLRREFEVLPPGDIRNCMAALAEDESLLSRLFQYRFEQGRGLKGHSFGNLFLTALTRITGDFAQAVRLSSEVLAIGGRIFPSTGSNVALRATLADGREVEGETRISRSTVPIQRIELVPGECEPMPETLEAIREADLITMGPGSLYTSVVPNLLVKGISRAIRRSRALKACFVNLMWQPGETTGLKASDHVAAIHSHGGTGLLELAVVNTAPVSQPSMRRYAKAQAMPVENDLETLHAMGLGVVGLDLLASSRMVRHDSEKTAAIALQLAKKGRRRRLHRAL
jgi:uncharacterized cofD-like protein